jgi:hypothetical protein
MLQLLHTETIKHNIMLTPEIDHHEACKALKDAYRKFGGGPKQSGLKETVARHPAFAGCVQWHFTPEEIIDLDLFNVTDLNTKTWAVLINIEIVHYLLMRGVNTKNIFFYSDCLWRTEWAKTVLDDSNILILPTQDKEEFERYIKMAEKKVDFVLNNVPFGMFKEFKKLALKLAKEKALIIAGTRDYSNRKSFENVEYYKYLGECFPTAQILASLAIINPAGATITNVIDKTGKIHPVATDTMQAPGEDIEGWLLATKVSYLELPGYNAQMGSLYYEKTIEDPTGTPCIFTVGESGDDNNFGRTKRINQFDLLKTKGIGLHKLVISKTGTPGKLGAMKYADPTWVCGFGTYFIVFSSKEEVLSAIQYCKSAEVTKLVKGVKPNTVVNGQAMWKQIPHHSQAAKWTHLA